MSGLIHKNVATHAASRAARFIAGALLLCSAALAAPRAHAAEIIPSLGMTRTPTTGDETRLSYGLAVRGNIAPMLAAEIGMSYRQDKLLNGQVESKQWPLTASLWAKPMPMLYAGGGVGWYNTTLHYPNTPLLASSTTQKFGVHLGGGITLPIVPGVASADLNGRYVYLGDQQSDLPPNKFKADYWTTSLGVAFHF
jgi:outer membrane protein with beta-barrel domain